MNLLDIIDTMTEEQKQSCKVLMVKGVVRRSEERVIDVDSVPTDNIIGMGMVSLNFDPAMIVVCQTDDIMTGYVFPLCKGFQIHYCNEYLRALNTDIDVEFVTYKQYSDLINACNQAVGKRLTK